MSDNNHLVTVQKVLASFRKMRTMNDRQIAALRANVTKAIAACEEAKDAKLIEVLRNIEKQLPERKARPANEPQTIDDIVSEYENEYQKKSGGEQAAFKAKLTRRINEAEAAKQTDDFNQLLALQVRMEKDADRIRRDFILASAADLLAIDGEKKK